MDSEKKERLLLSVILLLAFLLRFAGIFHDLPYSYYPDEVHFVKRALSFGSFDFNPHWFHKPAFYMYVLFFEYGIYYVIGKIVGLWTSVSDFAVTYIKNPAPFYIIGRFTSVLFSLGSILVVYRLGEHHFKKGVGIIAALFLSISYGHIASSQYIKADTPAMFFAILSILFLLNYLRERRLRDLILTSIFAGVGTATKYYPIVMLMPILICVVLVHLGGKKNLRQVMEKVAPSIGIIFISFYAAYFIFSPYNFLDPLGRKATFGIFYKVLDKVQILLGKKEIVKPPDAFINDRTDLFNGFIHYIKVLVAVDGMGVIIGSITIMGILYLLFQTNKKVFLFLFYPISFALVSVFMYPGYAEPRHQLPIYPFLVLAGSTLIMDLIEIEGLRKKSVLALMIISLSFPLFRIIQRDLYLFREDTRNVAKRWIESNIPSGTKLLVDENGPQLLRSERNLAGFLMNASAEKEGQFTSHYGTYLKYQLLAAKGSVTYDLFEIRLPWWREREERPGIHFLNSDYDRDMGNPLKPVGVMSYEFYRENGYIYAVVINEKYDDFLKYSSVKAKKFPSFYRFYKALFEKGKLVKEFKPDSDSKGPVIKIFKIARTKPINGRCLDLQKARTNIHDDSSTHKGV